MNHNEIIAREGWIFIAFFAGAAAALYCFADGGERYRQSYWLYSVFIFFAILNASQVKEKKRLPPPRTAR